MIANALGLGLQAGGGGALSGLLGLLGGPLGAGLTSLLPSLLGKLGIFGKDPQAELRKKLQQVASPQNQQAQTQGFYNQFLQSPAYSQAQSSIAGGSNAAMNSLQQSLGARGLGTSGIGAIAPAAISSMAGNQLGQLQAGAFSSAQSQAADAIQRQIQALLGGGAGPSQQQQLGAGGLDAFGKYMMQRYFPQS